MTERPGAIRNSEPPPNGALSHERGDPVNSADPWDPWVSGPPRPPGGGGRHAVEVIHSFSVAQQGGRVVVAVGGASRDVIPVPGQGEERSLRRDRELFEEQM